MAAFGIFVAGGLLFGLLFIVNWRALLTRPEVTVDVPVAGKVSVASLPPIPLQLAAPQSRPPAPSVSEVARPVSSVANNIVRTLLPEWKGTERINIALLGIDRRDDQPLEGTRSDTVMLVSIDPVGRSAAMVSVPRDLVVSIPGYGPQRVNTAHAYGGPDLAKRTLTENFGLPVQYFARVDFRGFEELVETMGGVMVDVERPIKDDEYPTEDYGYQRIYIAPGPQIMDGSTALKYARSRHSENDFGRARRQQRLLVAMRDRALTLNMLPRAPQLIGQVQKAMSTDLSATDLLALARLASEVDRERIANLVIDVESQLATPFRGVDGADLLSPNTPAIRRAIDTALKNAARPETRARVEVLNGTTRSGLGQQVADLLSAQGYTVTRIATAERRDHATTMIQVLGEARSAGDAAARVLGLAPSAVADAQTRNPPADLRITIGDDFGR